MNLTFDKKESADLRSVFSFFGALMNIGRDETKPTVKVKTIRRKAAVKVAGKEQEEPLTTVSFKQLFSDVVEDIMDDSWKIEAKAPAMASVKKMYAEKEAEESSASLDVPVVIDGVLNPAFFKGLSDSEIADAIKAHVSTIPSTEEETETVDVSSIAITVVLADGSVNPEFVATHSQTETIAALNAYYDKVEAEERAAAGAPVEAVTTSVDPVASFDGVLQDSVSKLATRFGNRTNKNRRNKGE